MSRVIRRLGILLLVLGALLVPAGPAFADFDPWSMSQEEMREAGFGQPDEDNSDYYCKGFSKATQEEIDVLNELRGTEEQEGGFNPAGENLCFDLSEGAQAACIGTIRDISRHCYSRGSGEMESETPLDPLTDPGGTMASNAADSIGEGVITSLLYGMFWLIRSWLLVPGPDLATNATQLFYPTTMWVGSLIAFLLLVWQSLRMMFKRRVEVLMQTVRGLLMCAAVTAAGVGILAGLITAGEHLTEGIIDVAFSSTTGEQWECEAPAAIAEEVKQAAEDDEMSVAQEHFLACSTASVDFGEYWTTSNYLMLIIVFGIVGLIMMFIQALILFVREAALPLIALMIPIVAAGQLGGPTFQRWLPGMASAAMTIVLFKPLVALIMAAGFSQAMLPSSHLDVLRGIITMFLSVIAPMVLFKAFSYVLASEQAASLGSTLNNVMLIQQIGSGMQHSADSRAANRAAATASRTAAKSAAAEAASGAAAVGTGGISLLAQAGAAGGEKAASAAAGTAAQGEKTAGGPASHGEGPKSDTAGKAAPGGEHATPGAGGPGSVQAPRATPAPDTSGGLQMRDGLGSSRETLPPQQAPPGVRAANTPPATPPSHPPSEQDPPPAPGPGSAPVRPLHDPPPAGPPRTREPGPGPDHFDRARRDSPEGEQ